MGMGTMIDKDRAIDEWTKRRTLVALVEAR
jgi:hypothetical protein